MRIIIVLICILFSNIHISNSQDLSKYWEDIVNKSEEYISYKKNKSNLKNTTLSAFLSMKKESSQYYNSIQNRKIESANKFSNIIFGTDSILKSIIYYDDEYTLYAAIDANGHISLGITLLNLLSEEEIIAVIAHEAAHLKLKHIEIGLFNYAKKRRNNEISASIYNGLYTATVLYNDYHAAKSGVQLNENYDYLVPTMVAISEGFRQNAEFQQRLYSKQMEIEADFAAANYLDYTGLGRKHLISALQKMRTYYTNLGYNTKIMGVNSTHPSLDERIKYLSKYRKMSEILSESLQGL